MIVAIILGRKHGSDEIELVAGPMPYDKGNAEFKQLILSDGDGFEEMYLHEIPFNGGRKRATFPKGAKQQAGTVGKVATDAGRDEAGIPFAPVLNTGEPTIDELKQIAAEEGIDVTECKRKKDFVETIAAHRQSSSGRQSGSDPQSREQQ